jgi:23S rRNA (guanosine2251-2'-O)-methyltransferase
VGGEQVEGRQAVAELLRAGRRKVYDVWLAEGVDQAPILQEIIEEAERRRVPIRHTARVVLERQAATEAPQGVLAHAAPLPEADLDDLCRRPDPSADPSDGEPPPLPLPFLLALDGVTDPQNVGALLRSADGAGATGAVLPRRRAAHVTPAVTKAAAGAVEHVPIAIVAGLPSALARAKELGCWVVGLADDGDTSLFDLGLATEPLVLVVGSEGEGLSRLARQRCDVVVSIPMAGTLPSLNVAAAGTLALYEVARRRAETR